MIKVFFFFQLFYFTTACNSKLTPCKCGENMIKPLKEIDEKLELKCKDFQLGLSKKKQVTWNKKVLDCSVRKNKSPA